MATKKVVYTCTQKSLVSMYIVYVWLYYWNSEYIHVYRLALFTILCILKKMSHKLINSFFVEINIMPQVLVLIEFNLYRTW